MDNYRWILMAQHKRKRKSRSRVLAATDEAKAKKNSKGKDVKGGGSRKQGSTKTWTGRKSTKAKKFQNELSQKIKTPVQKKKHPSRNS